MKLNKLTVLRIVLALFPLGIGLWLYPTLPNTVPTHWNFKGEIDGYSPKIVGAFMMPLISVLVLVGFEILPNFDPKRKKYKLFRREWEIIQVGLLGFFAYMQAVTMYAALNMNVDVGKAVAVGIGALLVLIGNYLGKIRQNFFLGIRLVI